MTERPRGSSDVDTERTQSIAEKAGHRLTGRGGVLLVTLAMLTMGLTMASTALAQADFGDYGSFVEDVSDEDLVPLLKTTTHGDVSAEFCIGYVEDPDEPSDKEQRAWFFHVASDESCSGETVKTSRSYRITEFGGSESQQWITDSDTRYTGKSFDQIASATSGQTWLCYLESDGIDGYSVGDPVYVDHEDFDSSGNTGDISVFDLRLTDVSSSQEAPFSVSPGIVASGDSDLSDAGDDSNDPTERPTATTLECGDFDAVVFDLGTQGTFDDDDVFYLDHADLPDDLGLNAEEARVHVGTVRITEGASVSGLEKVEDGDNDHRRFLERLSSPGEAEIATTDASSTADERVYIHFNDPDGTDDHILMHDVVVKGSSGTSASSQGQLVTSDSHAGVSIDDEGNDIENLIYYIDEDGDTEYDLDENVYIKHPDNDASQCLQVNDIRLNVDGENDGSLVESDDDDYSSWRSTSCAKGFVVKVENKNRDSRAPLDAVSTANYLDEDDDNEWDPSNENVYLGSVTNDSNETTYTRVWNSGSSDWTEFNCPEEGDPCGSQKLTSTSNVRTTGPDSDHDEDQSEQLYWSADDRLTLGDRRLGQNGPGGEVTSGDSFLTATQLQDRDSTLYISHDDCSQCFVFLGTGDIELATNYGDRYTPSDSDVVPETTVLGDGAQRTVRHDYSSSGLQDDTYYLDLSDNQNFRAASVLRLTPFTQEDRESGAFLSDSFTTETESTHNEATEEFYDLVGYIESGSQSGFGSDDYVYFDLPQSMGASASDEDTMSRWDARLNSFSFGGESFDAGSRVLAGDDDHGSFSGDAYEDKGTVTTNTEWQILHWDADRDGTVDSDDFLWLHKGDDGPTTPGYLNIRLSGSGGATDSGGSSGGGGGGGDGGTTETRPSISIDTPASGTEIDPGDTINIAGSADGGSDSISSVSATVDGESLTVTGTSSWSTSWTAPSDDNGTYTITATVTDTDGETDTATRDVQVGMVGEDSDGDGILDDEDNCPDSTNANQTDLDDDSAGDACDEDTDGDGLFDTHDECPREEGPVSNNGCPEDDETPDTDGDGIADPDDECPHDEGPRDNDGCPEEDGNETGDPDETPSAGLIAVLLASMVAVLIRRD